MIKLGNDNIGAMHLGSNSIGKAYLGSNLVFQKGGGPSLPYTPVSYIVTDGVAYISTGYAATPPMSSEVKLLLSSNTQCAVLSGFTTGTGSNSKNFSLLKHANKHVMFTYYYNYGSADGTPSVEYSIDNNKPFVVRTALISGNQSISVKQENSDSWDTSTFSQTGSISSTYLLVLFNGYQDGSYSLPMPAGSRLYYCKIYRDNIFTNPIRDFVPCIYNGEYGLWDKVSNSFFGNAASSGAFSGPSNS